MSHNDRNFLNVSVKRAHQSSLSMLYTDLYHSVVRTSWLKFLVSFAAIFLLINTVFGALYFLKSDSIAGTKDSSFLEYFFFSVQTLATIGYGNMFPQSLYGHILVMIEAMVGLLGVGIFAALAFARFSLPRSRVMFSKSVVISDFDGNKSLMFRVTNERSNRIIGAEVDLSLLVEETTREGQHLRRIYDLKLLRKRTPMLALTWLIVHPIDKDSPLQELVLKDLSKLDFALIVTINGLDETVSQIIHANYVYTSKDIKLNHRFVDLYRQSDVDESFYIDQSLIHETTEIKDF